MELPPVVLLDLYETCAWADWDRYRMMVGGIWDVDREVLDGAYTRTRSERNIGVYSSLEEEMVAVAAAAGLPPDPERLDAMVDAVRAFMAQHVSLYDDALPTIDALRERGHRVVLVSNCARETAAVVERLGLVERMDAVVLSVEQGVHKPDAGIYEIALDLGGAGEPADAVFVDDQAAFLDGAAALGIATLRIARRERVAVPGMPSGTGEHRTIGSLTDLLA